MDDSELSSALRKIRNRAKLAYAGPKAGYESQQDVPRLLSAVGEVLGMAVEAEASAAAAGVPVTLARLNPAVVRDAITRNLAGGTDGR